MDTVTHLQALGDKTLQGQCLPNPLWQSPRHPQGLRAPLKLCESGKKAGGQENSIQWNPGLRCLEKSNAIALRGFIIQERQQEIYLAALLEG